MSKEAPTYPQTRREDTVDCAAGMTFADPYHWLESESEEVQQWQLNQAHLADHYTHQWPYFDELKNYVEYYSVGQPTLPQYCDGYWFRAGSDKQTGSHGILVSKTPYGEGRLVYAIGDPDSGDQNDFLVWFSPSPNGQLLAIGLCQDGSENNTIQLIEVSTGKTLPDAPQKLLMDGLSGGVCWLPDSSGFYFSALVGDPLDFIQRVFFHHCLSARQTQVDVPLPNPYSRDYVAIDVSPDGRYRVAYEGLTIMRPIALQDVQSSGDDWVPFITQVNGSVIGQFLNDHLIAVTDVGAPRGRVVLIPLETASANDTSTWIEIVSESDAIIRTLSVIGKHLFITELIDTYSRIKIADLNGNSVGEVPLPKKVAVVEPAFPIMRLKRQKNTEAFLFSFSSFSESWGVYSYRFGDKKITALCKPQIKIDNIVVDDHWANAPDGSKIPFHCVRLHDTDARAPQPTLLFAYGGFNVATPPQYPAAIAAFIRAGGVYVVAHIRGGNEFGRRWWEAGSKQDAQNTYNDLYAVAENLIAQNRTTENQLALYGRSKGGLMAGVALTQRPELWKAVVPQVPVLDLIGTLRHPYGRYCCEIEYGDPVDPDAIRRIVDYSPYHQVNGDLAYPAVFFDAGATDPRCPPWHARKLAAQLQASTSGDSPILLRVWEKSGHGLATPRAMLIQQTTTWLAFVMCQLGMSDINPLSENHG